MRVLTLELALGAAALQLPTSPTSHYDEMHLSLLKLKDEISSGEYRESTASSADGDSDSDKDKKGGDGKIHDPTPEQVAEAKAIDPDVAKKYADAGPKGLGLDLPGAVVLHL